jgi:colicin import membrane protein
MIQLNSTLPPVPAGRDLESLMALLALVADPKAAQARITDLTTAAKSAGEQIEQARKDTEAAAELKQAAADAIAAERAKWDFQQRHESDEHRARMAAELAAIKQEREAAEATRAKADADAAEAARIKADLQRRIRLVTEAA